MLNMRSWEGTGWVPDIALPATHPATHPGYTSPSAWRYLSGYTAVSGRVNMVVGLISVAQLTSRALFSDIRGMTEVYNLVKIDNR